MRRATNWRRPGRCRAKSRSKASGSPERTWSSRRQVSRESGSHSVMPASTILPPKHGQDVTGGRGRKPPPAMKRSTGQAGQPALQQEQEVLEEFGCPYGTFSSEDVGQPLLDL